MLYSESKATAVASFFLEKAGKKLEDLKLMKLMYLAEREAIRLRNVGITGDDFYSMKNGPILSRTLNRLNPQDGSFSNGVWREHISVPEKWSVKLTKRFNYELELSRREIGILADIWQRFGSWTKWQLVDHVHEFAEWRNPGDSRLPIAFQDILSGLGLPPDERASRLAEHVALQRVSNTCL
jgi:uncharacterized phage-associated protein